MNIIFYYHLLTCSTFTIGPKAKNVVIEKKFGSPDIVRDGSTVAKEIEIENPISNLGAKLIEQVASKTKESAGDGTTTATILTQKMVQEGLKNIASGASPMELKKGMEVGLAFVLEKLSSKSISLGSAVFLGGISPNSTKTKKVKVLRIM